MTELGVCERCGKPCVQCSFEVQPDYVVCYDCVTDVELERFFDPLWWEPER